MNQPRPIEGDLDARELRFAIVASRFNEEVVGRLIEGATAALRRHGVEDGRMQLVLVPGAYDLPLIVRKLAQSGRADAVIALGAVIRGETPHFEYVSTCCAQGLARVADDTGIPVAFGVLTTDSEEQAMERAGGAHGNKGADAAEAAIRLATLLRRLGEGR